MRSHDCCNRSRQHKRSRRFASWRLHTAWLAAPLAASSVFASVAGGQRLRLESPVATIKHAADGTKLQAIDDVAVDEVGRILVLDSERSRILILSRTDAKADRVRYPKGFPTTLIHPIDMDHDENGQLIVLDDQRARLARFTLRDSAPSAASVLEVAGVSGVSSVCTSAGKIYVLGSGSSVNGMKLVHSITRDGAIQSSFGDQLGYNDFERILFGYGRLLCLQIPRLVVVASRFYPEIRAYDGAGSLRWRAELSQFRSMTITLRGSTGEYTYPPDSLWDEVSSVFALGRRVIGVQIGRRYGRRLGAKYVRIDTRFYSATDGRLLGNQQGLPLIKATTRRQVFAVDQAAEGTLLVYPYRFEQ